jgi:RimJ/RimL family protein N-acetyltransferase
MSRLRWPQWLRSGAQRYLRHALLVRHNRGQLRGARGIVRKRAKAILPLQALRDIAQARSIARGIGLPITGLPGGSGLRSRLRGAIVRQNSRMHLQFGTAFMTPTFRPLAAGDLPMLHEWLQRPHVRRWWNEPTTVATFESDDLRPPLEQSSARGYIAVIDDVPVGFIQSYVVMGSGGGWWENETDPGARGVDQFLADADQLGRGLGGTMVRAFVQKLFQAPEVTTVQTDPSPDNERAIRCYRRAGFMAVGEVVTPDGPALLMRTRRSIHSRDV